MSKAPTVSEVVGNSNVTFKPAIATCVEDRTRPDFNTDVLWKHKRADQKQRTMSVSSTDSEASGASIPNVNVPRPRRLSFSEMVFGSHAGGFGWGQSSVQTPPYERKGSVTEDERFKELMKYQNKILGDS